MRSDAGSPANLPCPQCRSVQVKVALTTPTAVFYRCSMCLHGWSVPAQRPAPDSAPGEPDHGRVARSVYPELVERDDTAQALGAENDRNLDL